jgi:flagellar motor protein MotB
VNALRLSTVGKGESVPVESNATEAGRRANRRVEIYVQPVVENS